MNPTAVLEPALVPPPAARDEEPFYEVVNGKRVELPPMSIYAVRVANRLAMLLNRHAETHGLGEALHEGLFRLPLARDGNRNRRPDVAFVSYARWPKDRPMPLAGNAWDVVPDLAVEVISPTDLAEELFDKLAEYFEAGVRQAWVLFPSLRMVQVYEALTKVRGLLGEDELDGGDVILGFRTPVAALFPAVEPPASS